MKKLFSLLLVLCAMLCAQHIYADNVYIVGSMNGWDATNAPAFTYNAQDGIYYYYVRWQGNTNLEFKLSTQRGGWDAIDNNSIAPNNGTTSLSARAEYTLAQRNNGNLSLPGGSYVLCVDLAHNKLKIMPQVFIAGSMQGWRPDNAISMQYSYAANKYFYTIESSSTEQFRLSYKYSNYNDWGDFDSGTIGRNSTLNMEVDKEYDIWDNNSNNTSNMVLPGSGKWQISLDITGTPTCKLSVEDLNLDANMPLTRADFAGGRKHYFLVGSRMGDWRLQPEWELKPSADGNSVSIDARLMYLGCFGVAVVDNYRDYAKQKYTMYNRNAGNTQVHITKTNTSATLTNRGQCSAIDFDNLPAQSDYDSSKYLFFNTGYQGTIDQNINMPLFARNITVALSDGVPTNIAFDLSEADTYYNYMVFGLVGSDIINEKDIFDNTKAPCYPIQMTDGWQNSYVQYDGDGNPYYDANGDYLYQTVFQPSWLNQHPSLFYRSALDLDYDSQSMTLVNINHPLFDRNDPYMEYYRSKLTEGNNTIGGGTAQSGDNYNYTETLLKHRQWGEDNETRTANWECYVAKDVWLDGEFKIWSGFGGNDFYYNGCDTHQAQFYYANGGHYDEGYPYVINAYDINSGTEAVLYSTAADVFGANFKTNGLRYYKRIIVWYDKNSADLTSHSFNNSVVQFIVETYGPNIRAYRTEGSFDHLTAKWTVPFGMDGLDGTGNDAKMKSYVINRYRIVDGEYVLDRSNISTGNINDETVAATFNNGVTIDINDSEALSSGRYAYEVVLTFTNGAVKHAMSNVILVYSASTPVTASARQRTEKSATGSTLYSMDVVLDLGLTQSAAKTQVYLSRDTSTPVDVISHIQAYRITVDDATAAALNQGTQSQKFVDNQLLVPFNPQSIKTSVRFDNVCPLTINDSRLGFNFSIDLVPMATLTQDNTWENLQFGATNATAQFTIPSVSASLSQAEIVTERSADASMVEDVFMPFAITHGIPAGAYLSGAASWNDLTPNDRPVQFNNVNSVRITCATSALPVTQSVIDHWAINTVLNVGNAAASDAAYRITLTGAESWRETCDRMPIITDSHAQLSAQTYQLTNVATSLTRNSANITANGVAGAPLTLDAPTFDTPEASGNNSMVYPIKVYDNNTHQMMRSYNAILSANYVQTSTLAHFMGMTVTQKGNTLHNNADLTEVPTLSSSIIGTTWDATSEFTDVLDTYTPWTPGDVYTDQNNWSAAVTEAQYAPINVQHIGCDASTGKEISQDQLDALGTLTVHFTTYYPFISVRTATIGRAKEMNGAPGISTGYEMTYFIPAESGNASVDFDLSSSQTSGVNDIVAEAEGDAENVLYNLQGIRISGHDIPAGVYIMQRGDKATKVVIK